MSFRMQVVGVVLSELFKNKINGVKVSQKIKIELVMMK